MNFGAEFDDEIFEEPKGKNYEFKPVTQGAKLCEPKWFMDENVIGEDSEEVLKCLKYKADYLYFSKNYQEASAMYNKYMTMLPTNNITAKRECMENLARSYLHQNCDEEALEWALKMHAVAVSSDQKLVSWTLLAKVCHKLKKFEEELEALHCCLETHKSLPEFWMRLAYCYSGLFKIDLPGSCLLSSDSSPDPYCCAFKSRIASTNHPSTSTDSTNHISEKYNEFSSSSLGSKKINLDKNHSCDSVMCSKSNDTLPGDREIQTMPKCEMCDLATQVISACLIRTRLLLNNCEAKEFNHKKHASTNERITDCLNHLEVDQLFIEEASKMLKHELYSNVQKECLPVQCSASDIVTKINSTTDVEKTDS